MKEIKNGINTWKDILCSWIRRCNAVQKRGGGIQDRGITEKRIMDKGRSHRYRSVCVCGGVDFEKKWENYLEL